jgi:hypothetical protein
MVLFSAIFAENNIKSAENSVHLPQNVRRINVYPSKKTMARLFLEGK